MAAELIADLFVSLDGFAGGEGFGPYFGYGGPELDAWIEEHLAEPQLVVLGRKTYEVLADVGGPGPLTQPPKLVVSQTLEEPLAWANTRILRGDAATELDALKREAATPLRTMGSLSLVRSLLHAGVLDRLRLTVFPLIAGPRGREPFFEDLPAEHLALDSSRVLDGGVVVLDYRVTSTKPASSAS